MKVLNKYVIAIALISSVSLVFANDKLPETFDGLEKVESKPSAALYVKPGADFSGYSKVQLLDAHVAFKKNWQRDHNRNTKSYSEKISNKDVLIIKERVAKMFALVFKEEFEEHGYPVVEVAEERVLLIRPAIVNLNIYSPQPKPTLNKAYSQSTGSATIYLELYDAVSGEILARVAENKISGNRHYYTWANKSQNSADGKRLLKSWAKRLREKLDEAKLVNKAY